jgi:hypothetical protein
MDSNQYIGYSDGDSASLAEIVADVESTKVGLASMQVAQIRALARAGALAAKQAARSSARVREHDMALRAIAAEIAGILQLTDRSVQRQIDEACELVDDYPATLSAWEEGRITRGHVRVISDTGTMLPREIRPEFERIALEHCVRDTPGRVRTQLEILAERMHPRTLGERHRDAREGRMVRVTPLSDGMSDLTATLPTLLADAIYDRLTQQARITVDARAQAKQSLRETQAGRANGGDESGGGERLAVIASDRRTTDQLRADLLADMLLTTVPGADPTRTDDGPGLLGAVRGKVQVVVSARTLLGTDDGPADLIGRSPIDPDTARELAGLIDSPWERVLTHPVSGAVLHVDTYQRPASMDRYLRGRDVRCRFPGCGMPAIRCEVDHNVDHALGGKTEVCNLCHLCQRHHSVKQFTPWKVRQLEDGIIEWTSPLGRVYIEEPPVPTVHFDPEGFAPGEDPPPF